MVTLMLSENSSNSHPVAVNRKKVIEELVQGRRLAERLRILLQRPFGGDGSSEVAEEELVVKILRSFTKSLSVLCGGGGETISSAGEVQGVCYDDSLVSGGRRLEDYGESKKRLSGPKGRRGCYKRKKNSETWRTETATIEDGHAWRKYGQKDILNTTHPRSYFRCTHKYDQGCKATKQVQKIENNPQMYETIYIGNHTCRNQVTYPVPQMIVTGNNGPWTSSTTSASALSSSSTPSTVVVKQEYNFKEETPSTGDDLSENLSSSHHYHHDDHDHEQLEYSAMWEDLVPLETDVVVSSVYSCRDIGDHHQNHHHIIATTSTTTSHGLNTDFDTELCFDETDIFLSS